MSLNAHDAQARALVSEVIRKATGRTPTADEVTKVIASYNSRPQNENASDKIARSLQENRIIVNERSIKSASASSDIDRLAGEIEAKKRGK